MIVNEKTPEQVEANKLKKAKEKGNYFDFTNDVSMECEELMKQLEEMKGLLEKKNKNLENMTRQRNNVLKGKKKSEPGINNNNKMTDREVYYMLKSKGINIEEDEYEYGTKWEGDRLIRLSLVYNDLGRSLPREIGNLTKLTSLVLSSNNLTSIPKEIGNLTNLKDLNLEDNFLYSLPSTIGNLTNLEYLNLENNKLTELPKEIVNLTNLEMLELGSNPGLSMSDVPESLRGVATGIYR